MIRRKYVLKLTRRGLTGLTLIIILGAIWMFVLGIFVGRSTVPVTLNITDIKERLALLKDKNEKGVKTTVDIKALAEKERLGFYEDLKENRSVKTAKTKQPELKDRDLKKSISSDNTAAKKAERKKKNFVNLSEDKKKGFTIQVASVKDEKTADRMVAELKRDGYPAYKTNVEIPELGAWFRVRVGHYNSKNLAVDTVEGLKKRNYKPMLLKE